MSQHACAELVRQNDPDRFAATLAAPAAARPQLWPIYALNLQLTRAPWASSEPLVAEMRLQWWVDALGDLAKGNAAPQHEVLQALAPLLAETPALAVPLAALAEAQRRMCWREGFATDEALAAHLDATSGHLMWAAALALGAPVAAEPVVRDFAFGAGSANWLLAVPELSRRGLQPLPEPAAESAQALALAGLARIAAARKARAALPRNAAPALFSGWLARGVLRRAAAAPERVAEGRLAPSEFARRAGLMLAAFTGRW
ncbi:squalene/phytoene synthase family protein [Phaeovulum sp.]|uniref:squalene/phytoene synthase family protein n=1 Tax=Phaeovulum sp. TaxID=2934796 RepID=UPI00273058D3|nr:squalene/phytoene synthase family protein [Phaeovulum sp.]MDP1667628.1 squalene/phytoene synthase family protein [Phaeovulum sp.]MDZ4118481.1 squalene/phytoene synthase family protein [Phaeovulum sp.]